jgi:dGTP triphosphohydrolase
MTNRVVATAWAAVLGIAVIAPVSAATAADVKEKAVEAKDTIKEKAVETKDTLKEKAVDAKDTIKEKAVDAKDAIKEKTVDTKDAIKEKTHAMTDKVKSKLHRNRTAKVDHYTAMDVREAQSSLKAKGFDPGTIDGRYGPRTQAAVQDFQRSEGLTITGKLDADTSARLTSPSASPATEPAREQDQTKPKARQSP